MKSKSRNFLSFYILTAIATFLAAGNAFAADDWRRSVEVKGTSFGQFVQDDPIVFSEGRVINHVNLAGNFEITVGDTIRTGRFDFPHLLVFQLDFPDPMGPPVFVAGHVIGAVAWIFDDGVICDGPSGGKFDETGFGLESKGLLVCNDGTRLKLKIKNVEVDPGVSVKSEIRGKLVYPQHDD